MVKTYMTSILDRQATPDTSQTLTTKWHLGHVTIQNNTYLGMSGSQTSTHELVRARTSASLMTLDLPFSTRLRELYAGGAK
jgi:hypothetical protein